MTPEERELVADLFDRLAQLERERRDPDAERLIREGLARAPNAVYALVQTTLLQDEALKTANERIADLEAQRAQPQPGGGSFLGDRRTASGGGDGKWNTGEVLRGSVPSVRAGERPMGLPPGYSQDRGFEQGGPGGGYGGPPGGGYGGPPDGGYGGPGAPDPGRGGGGFLGTAAAVAAGAIGGGLLLNGIRSALGGGGAGGGKGPFSGAFDQLGKKPGTEGPAGGGSGDLSRSAGLDDIGGNRQGAGNFSDKPQNFANAETDNDGLDANNVEEEEDFSDDAFDADDE